MSINTAQIQSDVPPNDITDTQVDDNVAFGTNDPSKDLNGEETLQFQHHNIDLLNRNTLTITWENREGIEHVIDGLERAGFSVGYRDGTIMIFHDDPSNAPEEVSIRFDNIDHIFSVTGQGSSHWGLERGYTLARDSSGSTLIDDDARQVKYYFSDSADNSGSGKSVDDPAPLSKINRLYSEFASSALAETVSPHFLLERGSVFDDIWLGSMQGASALRPVVISSYGEGDAPLLTGDIRVWDKYTKNVVIKGIKVNSIDILGNSTNLLIEDVVSNDESRIHSHNGTQIKNVTLYRFVAEDVFREAPKSEGSWSPRENRKSGIFTNDVDGLRFEESVFDYTGWREGFNQNISEVSWQPPNKFSHAAYNSFDNEHVSSYFSVFSRGASFGAQFRSGAHLQGNLFIENNIALGMWRGERSLLIDNAIIHPAFKDATDIGGQGWGADFTLPVTIIENFALGEPGEERLTRDPFLSYNIADGEVIELGNVVEYWGSFDEYHNGLKRDVYEAFVKKFGYSPMNSDFYQRIRNGERSDMEASGLGAREIVDYLRITSGMESLSDIEVGEEFYFKIDEAFDGFRWSTRSNWNLNRTPGSNDHVNIDGASVQYSMQTLKIASLDLGNSGFLHINGGQLSITDVNGVQAGEIEGRIEVSNGGSLAFNFAQNVDNVEFILEEGEILIENRFTGRFEIVHNAGEIEFVEPESEIDIVQGSSMMIDTSDAFLFSSHSEEKSSHLAINGGTLSIYIDEESYIPIGMDYFQEDTAIAFELNSGRFEVNLETADEQSNSKIKLFGGSSVKIDEQIEVVINVDGRKLEMPLLDVRDGNLWLDLRNTPQFPVPETGGPPKGLEIGSMEVLQSNSDTWHSVDFAEPIANARVVMGPLTLNGWQDATVRVKDVTDSGFKFQVDEWDYLDGFHRAETVSWMAVSEGTHTLASGQTISAGRASAFNTSWTKVSYAGFDKAPAVFTQVSSARDDAAVATRVKGTALDGFRFRLQEEEAADGIHGAEDVDWIAFDYGTDGVIDVASVSDVDHLGVSVDFDSIDGTPALLASMQTMNGVNTATLRISELGSSGASIVVREEQSLDRERWHVGEDLAFLSADEGRYELL